MDRCYQSFKDQTYTNWQWVVVNDGSTDGTDVFFKSIADKRIKYLECEKNMGRAYARTIALDHGDGDWIVVWDADDIHFPDRLEKINWARERQYDFFCSYAIIVANDFKIKTVGGFGRAGGCLPRTFMHTTLACRTDIARRIGYDSIIETYGGIGEDVRIIYTLAKKYKGCWYEDALSVYFEDHELDLRKAIDCNKSKYIHFKALTQANIIPQNKSYYYLLLKQKIKMGMLNLLRLYPAIYRFTTVLRNHGEYNINESLVERVKLVEYSSPAQLLAQNAESGGCLSKDGKKKPFLMKRFPGAAGGTK